MERKEVLVLRDKVIPVVDLAKVFARGCARRSEDKYIVICNIGDKTIGVKARAVEGQEEVVIKPLGTFLGNIKGVGGRDDKGGRQGDPHPRHVRPDRSHLFPAYRKIA